MHDRTIAIIGLGKMGGNLALQALEKNWKVVGFTLGEAPSHLIQAGLQPASSLAEMKDWLTRPRRVLLYIPAGKAVDALLEQLRELLEPGDIVMDGGNSYWGDSIARHQRLAEKGIRFIDLGTSGGISGARNGACFMAGGDTEAVEQVKDFLTELAVPDGFVHAGPSGAGHFTKLVHNGIEFGMLQAIGEGMQLLKNWPHHELPIADVLRCWNHGSVIRSWLIELMEKQYRDQNGTAGTPSFIEDTGEVNWLVSDAVHMEVPVPVIALAVMQLFASRDMDRTWARSISLMRHGFGGHPFGPSAPIEEERKTGRLSDAFLGAHAENERKKAA